MVKEGGKAALARSAMVAIEPLVELFLELGISSPEAESLLRSVFVHTARKWLAKGRKDGSTPSDVRVSLVSGVHRNFVREILTAPPRTAAGREQSGHPASRVLEAWYTDTHYLDSSGKPRDLSLRYPEPSFVALASAYAPGVATGVLLQELRRASLVQLLPEDRVRVRSRTYRVSGVNASTMSELGSQAGQLLQTLIHNMRESQSPLFCEATQSIEVEAERVAAVRELIARRTQGFLATLQQEMDLEAGTSRRKRSQSRVRIGLTAFASEQCKAKSSRKARTTRRGR